MMMMGGLSTFNIIAGMIITQKKRGIHFLWWRHWITCPWGGEGGFWQTPKSLNWSFLNIPFLTLSIFCLSSSSAMMLARFLISLGFMFLVVGMCFCLAGCTFGWWATTCLTTGFSCLPAPPSKASIKEEKSSGNLSASSVKPCDRNHVKPVWFERHQLGTYPPVRLQCHLAAQPSLPLSPWTGLQLFWQEPDTPHQSSLLLDSISITSLNFTKTILQIMKHVSRITLEHNFHLHNDQLCSFLLGSFPLDHTRRRPSPDDHIRSCRFSLLNWFRLLWGLCQ